MMKSAFDFLAAFCGLVLLSPVFVAIAILIRIDDPGPVFFRQERVGRHGRPFRIHKFRTMVTNGDPSRQLTIGDDARITRIGRFLRKTKLDEFPQLIDVIAGNMSLVGPRPEVPRYVAMYPADLRKIVLSVKPGITDLASIEYRDESAMLASAVDAEAFYVEQVLPAKLAYYRRYVETRTFWGDIRIILRTLAAIAR